ncbi:MAG: ABC transporter permease [Firmicutes bacterium]|nr:ABC transporter permease [Bacillota bacterium]
MKKPSKFNRLLRTINGPFSLGRTPVFWLCLALVVGYLFAYPKIATRYDVINLTYFISWTFVAMGLSLIWGCGNILSFGQMAFVGIGGYAYGVIAINTIGATGNTVLALVGGVVIPFLVAALLGYFVFYGRVSGVYVSIMTLVFTLVLETFMEQTGGSQWRIGKAVLGGYNGMTNIPPITFGTPGASTALKGASLYYFAMILMVVIYLFLRFLVNSRYGVGLIATGSNPERTEVLGYDTRLIQLIAFAIAGGLAGLTGVLYVAWGHYITPSTMGLTNASLPVIWVAVGGRKSVLGSIIFAILLQYFTQFLAVTGSEYALIVLGALLLMIVMYMPEGVLPPIFRWLGGLGSKKNKSVVAGAEPRGGANA